MMYLQRQLLDGTKSHLPGDASHLIYHTPVSDTASTDGQICSVCLVLLFIVLCYTSVTSKLDFCNSRKASHTLFESEPQERYCQNNNLLKKSFLVIHPTLVL